jgi:hypothetical protein
MRNFLLLILVVVTPAIASGETLKGVVKDSAGTPISGAMVFIHWDSAGSTVGLKSNVGIKTDLTLRTKEDGTFNIDLPPGFYDAFAATSAFTPACRKIRLKPGEPMEITFRLDADPLYASELGNRVEIIPPKH